MGIVTIIGAGMMGSAMTYPACDNDNEVRLVGTPLDREIIKEAAKTGNHITLKRTLPAGIRYYQIEDLEQAIENADVLVCGVSSFGVDWFMETILPQIPESLPILCVTKGMINTADGRFIPYPHYYQERYPDKKYLICAIGGPCISFELADHHITEVCFCGEDIALLRELKSFFATSYYYISLCTDLVGVECAVAMKNAYALGVALTVGFSQQPQGIQSKEQYNPQAAVFGQSIKEIRRILSLYGGGADMIDWAAGDLYVTLFGGRTRLVGTLLGRGYSFQEAAKELKGVTLESVVIATRTAQAIRELIDLGKANAEDFPLLLHIDEILTKGLPANIPWEAFESETIR